jgi:hypothetical protein
MMRRHIFNRPSCYTHPVGTATSIIAIVGMVGVFLAFMCALTPSFISWVD